MPVGSSSSICFTDITHAFTVNGQEIITALSGLNFSVGRNEFVSVLGPSGCGKSTLLRLVSGLLRPTQGTVEVAGETVTGPRDEVGIVFQRPTLLPWLNVLDNVTFPMKHKYGRVRAEDVDRAMDMLKLVGLEAFAKRAVQALSGGMQQRVGIARALLLDPKILLMDEPFSALDALTRDEMSFELLKIWSEYPKAVLFITHSIAEAVLLSDRIIVMSPRPGRVREIIDVPLERPRSLATLDDPVYQHLSNQIRERLFSRREDTQEKGVPA